MLQEFEAAKHLRFEYISKFQCGKELKNVYVMYTERESIQRFHNNTNNNSYTERGVTRKKKEREKGRGKKIIIINRECVKVAARAEAALPVRIYKHRRRNQTRPSAPPSVRRLPEELGRSLPRLPHSRPISRRVN